MIFSVKVDYQNYCQASFSGNMSNSTGDMFTVKSSFETVTVSNLNTTTHEDNTQTIHSIIHMWFNLIGLPVVMLMSAIGNTLSFIVMINKTMRKQTTSW